MKVDQDAALVVKNAVATELGDVDATVGITLPDDWTPTDGDHIQVDTDGGPAGLVATWHTIRITVWSADRSRAVELANITRARLLTRPAADGIHRARPGTATLTARDPRTGAYMASFTVTVPIRPRTQ